MTPRREFHEAVDPSPAILAAIIEGEAYAVGLRGALSTGRFAMQHIKAKAFGSTDLPERVARSFGGAVDDKFIQARLRGIHLRAATKFQFLSSEPRRGFDTLVEVLLTCVKTTTERDLEKEIARTIGAADDDQTVRALTVRILALRGG